MLRSAVVVLALISMAALSSQVSDFVIIAVLRNELIKLNDINNFSQ